MTTRNSFPFRTALQLGLIAGAVGLLLALVGMVTAFGERDIIAGTITLGELMLLGLILAFSFSAVGRSPSSGAAAKVALGVIVGVAAEAVLIGLLLLGQQVNLRPVFPNASPELYGILRFGLEGVTAYATMLGAGAVAGGVGALMSQAPPRYRQPLLNAVILVALLGLLEDLIGLTLRPSAAATQATRWLLASGVESGLTRLGAAVVFVGTAAATTGLARLPRRVRAPSRPRTAPRSAVLFVAYAVLLGAMLFLPNVAGSYLSEVTNSVGLFLIMALGLNIVVGYAGLLDLGYVAFFAIGAYTTGVLTSSAIGPAAGQIVWGPQWPFWQALPVAIGMTLLAGIVLGIPVLRMRGDYLAIVTLGFGEIVRIAALSDAFKPYVGGSQGIVSTGDPMVGATVLNSPQTLYPFIYICALIAIFISLRLRDSRQGRAWMAMREDEDVAQAMGIRLVPTKLLAFATGAGMAGLSGAIFATKVGSIYPHSFNLLISINVLAIVIIGGMGSIPGVIAGALAIYGLPELLREFSEFRLFVFGALLIGMMLYRPEGLWPEAARQRELHAEEDAEEPVTAVEVDAAGSSD